MPQRAAQPEAKRPDLRVVQTGRLPKLELKLEADPIPELIQDEPPAEEIALEPMYADDVSGEEVTTEVEALADADADADMNVQPEFVDETPQVTAGAGQFEFYGQIFELHAQQLVKLKGNGGTRRFEILVRDAQADNEFGVAPDRVLQDVHDPSANSDLDRIVVEQLLIWMDDNRGAWETEPASFSVNVGMGTIADPKFASFVATSLKNHKIPAKAMGFEIPEKSCVDQVRDVDMFVQACEKIGCHVVLDDFTFHHNSMRWLGSSALKFVKLDPKITAVAMKDRVPQALVVAIAQASQGARPFLRRQACRYPGRTRLALGRRPRLRAGFPARPAALPERAGHGSRQKITTRRVRRAPGRLSATAGSRTFAGCSVSIRC